MTNKIERTTKGFEIYNKSSERMNEVVGTSIDLLIADPPWNVGLQYGEKTDNAPHKDYIQMMRNVVSEIEKVLKTKGKALLILPSVARKKNAIYNYPQIFTNLFQEFGFLNTYQFNFSVQEEDFTCIPAKDIVGNGENCHSEEIQGIIFSKIAQEIKRFPKDKIYKYASQENHPCPYPFELVKDMLDTFYKPGDKVLDPFMGTGGLGKEVLRRNGQFIGYEINKNFYETALKKLKGAKNEEEN
jgi:DNA modification methylase